MLRLCDIKDYDKSYIIFEDFKFEDFQRIELLIFLVHYLNIPGKIEDYYLILGGRSLISRHTFDNGDYLIQNARILLKTLNQKKVYIDELRRYETDGTEKEKLYRRENNRFVKVENVPKDVAEREELYLKLLSLDIQFKPKSNKYGFKKGKRFGIVIDNKPLEIKPIDDIVPVRLNKPKKKKMKPIKIQIGDLIKQAQDQDEIFAETRNKFRRRILENTTFKSVEKEKIKNTDEINISNVVNIVGQVGSGKTTFSDAVIELLVKSDKKIVIIEPSVPKVLSKSEQLERLGTNVVPVIGSSDWKEHINKSSNGEDFLNDFDSKILTSGCALGGLIEDVDVSIEYGDEPCTKIYKYYERGKDRLNQLKMDERYVCPFYYRCPRTQAQANIYDTNVIVTTTAALSTMTIGISGMTLFEYTLNFVDLVIVDEAENELQKVDKIFAPYVPFDDYIRSNGGIPGNYYRMPSDDRTSTDDHLRGFIDLHHESDRIFAKINNLLRRDRQGFNKSQLERTFTGKMLINECRNRDWLSRDLCDDLDKMAEFNRNRKFMRILKDLVDVTKGKQLRESFEFYGWGTVGELSQEQVNRVIFITSVLYFEYIYRELSNLVGEAEHLPKSTKAILNQRYEFHQRYIPVSPIGNVFGLQYKSKNRNEKADLCIVKQFATGRTMYLRFPWLKLDANGKPMGPNVMLLSGSSFSPGSFANHINEPVNYIIESEQYKRDFIKKSHMEYLNTDVYVSGSGKSRNNRLRELVIECKELIYEKLETDNNILMIVNSYEDTEVVKTALKETLKNTLYKNQITYLVPDHDNSDDPEKIKQSKVAGFVSKNARILVAPAILIERGHNIVNEYGNAAFDTLLFMTRPMSRPDDYTSHVSKVNGYIMGKYANKNYQVDTELFQQMRKDAFNMYYKFGLQRYRLEDLDSIVQKDIVVTLFVMILQIFGRLCRIGNQEDMKSRAPDVYFADAAFKAKNKGGFDLLNRLLEYLEQINRTNDVNGKVAKTLYEPFYQALKGGKNIYDK